VEPPGGDPVRGWRALDEDGTSLWWRSLGRNKRSIVIDLRTAVGRALARRLALRADVVLENFRPGTMERWGLGPGDLLPERPDLVYARVSGYGQTGPDAAKPGFAAVCEAAGGLRHLTGHPGEAPVRANLSLGDTLAALHCALGVLLALLHRERAPGRPGQVVDTSILESVVAVLESSVPECDRLGLVRGPSGTTITGVVPTNVYRCADGRRLVVGANGDSIFRRLMQAIGREDLGRDPGLATNALRVPRAGEIDAAVAAFARGHSSADLLALLEAAGVPAAPVRTAADLLADPHLAARGAFERVPVGGRPLALSSLPPRLSATPGRTEFAGPELDADADRVLTTWLGAPGPAGD
jgi:crotonobetainyl-CoA:carnitine CoA-transferase CaiB-like acyl-CoA transferase